MKFGKNLLRIVEISDPEWGVFWINYKLLKKKINDIVTAQAAEAGLPHDITKSNQEIEFFRSLKYELKKATDFFSSSEQLYGTRLARVQEGYRILMEGTKTCDKAAWRRLLAACVKLYKDVLLLENFAIMNYCGVSKILKKHDKLTSRSTRDAFMRNVMSHHNLTHYPSVLKLIKDSERLFSDIQAMESQLPLQDEEKLFIEAIRDLNQQAIFMQAEERVGDPSPAPPPNDGFQPNTQAQSQHGSYPAASVTVSTNIGDSSTHPAAVVGPSSMSDNTNRWFQEQQQIRAYAIDGAFFEAMSYTHREVIAKVFPMCRKDGSEDGSSSDPDNEGQGAMSRLDKATSIAVHAATKLSSHSPSIPEALSWIHEIAKKPETAAVAVYSEDSEDQSASRIAIKRSLEINSSDINPAGKKLLVTTAGDV